MEKLKHLTQEQAVEKMQAGEKIENCYIEQLHLQNQEVNFSIEISDCHIGSIDFTQSKMKQKLHFENVIFEGAFICGWEKATNKNLYVEFLSSFLAKNCSFKEKVVFGGSIFHSIISCQDCVFHKHIVFRSAHFQQQLYLWGSKFCANSSFQDAIFQLEGHFDNCKFMDDVSFEKCTFKGQDASFNEIQSHGKMNFQNVNCECYFSFSKSNLNGEIFFQNIHFKDEVNFDETKFNTSVYFDEANFLKEASFSYTQFYQSSFLATSFQNVTFLNAQFHNEAFFNLDYHTRLSLYGNQKQENTRFAQFYGLADFTNVRFHKRAIFEQVHFEQKVRFANCFFAEQANFAEIKSNDEISFERIYCNQEFFAAKAQFNKIIFDYADINRRLDLSDATLKSISFYKATVDLMIIEKHQIQRKLTSQNPKDIQHNRSYAEYLLLKESFHKRGLHDEEDWAYYKFRQSKRKNRTRRFFANLKTGSFGEKIIALFKLPFSFMERIFIDQATGYGTRPFNITLVAISFVVLFGAIYSYFPEMLLYPENMPFKLPQALYFSLATFTTMGFGDIQPQLDTIMPYIVSIEAFLGLFIMTLFVGTYTRKIIR